MQSHLDSVSSRGTFSSMLQSDPFGPPSHEYSMNNHSNGSPGSDFGHLLNSSSNHNNHSPAMNNNHLHHNNNNHTSNHSSSAGTGETKPKKAPPPNGKKTKGRVKIKMEFIDNKLRRYTTFSKRKTGIMKKAYELSTLTGTQVMLLVASETGHVYTFATRKLQPMITSEAGKALIQTCLNSPDPPTSGSDTQRMSATGYEETELTYAADSASDHGDVKVRLSSSPYSTQSQPMGGLHHSPSMYGSPINNNYHPSPATSSGMMFPHSPSPNSNVLYHYPSDPQQPCYTNMHSPTSPHLSHLPR